MYCIGRIRPPRTRMHACVRIVIIIIIIIIVFACLLRSFVPPSTADWSGRVDGWDVLPAE